MITEKTVTVWIDSAGEQHASPARARRAEAGRALRKAYDGEGGWSYDTDFDDLASFLDKNAAVIIEYIEAGRAMDREAK